MPATLRLRLAAAGSASWSWHKKSLAEMNRQGSMWTDPTETRTPVAGMKTRCPRPLDDGANSWRGSEPTPWNVEGGL